MEYIRASRSASEALTLPIAVWFSGASKANDAMTGLLSLRLFKLTITSLLNVSIPSVTETVMAYEFCSS